MKTTKYLFAGLLMLSVSTQSFAQDAKKVDELTKIIAENKNNPAATKAVVKNYMKLNKKDAVAVAALGKAFLNLDDMTNATEYANLAIKANKHHAAGYLLRGDIAVAKDNGGEAATWYQNAMLMAPNTPEGYIKYARIYQKVDAEGAVATLEKLRTIDPNYLVDAEIGYMYSKNGQLQKAVEAYDKVRNIESMENYMISDYASSSMILGQTEKSLKVALAGVNKAPRNAGFNRIAFYDYTDLKDYDNALLFANNLFNNSDSVKVLPSDYKYYAHALKGAGRHEEAIQNFLKVYELDNNEKEALKLVSDVYREQKDYPKALEYYNQYFNAVSPKRASDFTALARIYMDQAENATDDAGKKEALLNADKVYSDLAEAMPNNLDYATYNRAHVYYMLNPDMKIGAAKPYYEKYAELLEAKTERSNAENSTLAEACNYLAVHYIQNNNVQMAKVYAAKLQELRPDDDTAAKILSIK